MSAEQELLRVDGRRRVTLGDLARHDFYLAETNQAGHIVLIPAHILPADHPLAAQLEEVLVNPKARIRRGRPQRHTD